MDKMQYRALYIGPRAELAGFGALVRTTDKMGVVEVQFHDVGQRRADQVVNPFDHPTELELLMFGWTEFPADHFEELEDGA